MGACACAWIVAGNAAAQASVDSSDLDRQSRDDAWWTGPILAASAGSMPKGHWLVEPYVFNVNSNARYDNDRRRHPKDRSNSLGNFTYINYGLTDRLTVGAIPRFAYNDVSQGQDSSGIRIADLSLQAQYRLTQYTEGSKMPTIGLNLSETFPTGRYDGLGSRPSDGVGAGAYTTTLSLYSQYFLWMPNGRIVRTRFNLSYAISDHVNVEDVSVYGTNDGFRGSARPGNSFTATSAWEYSATRNWVLAIDVAYQRDSTTSVRGVEPRIGSDFPRPMAVAFNSGVRETLSLSPAIEYNWNGRMGIIVGTVFTAAGRNAAATLIPVTAINMVF